MTSEHVAAHRGTVTLKYTQHGAALISGALHSGHFLFLLLSCRFQIRCQETLWDKVGNDLGPTLFPNQRFSMEKFPDNQSL